MVRLVNGKLRSSPYKGKELSIAKPKGASRGVFKVNHHNYEHFMKKTFGADYNEKTKTLNDFLLSKVADSEYFKVMDKISDLMKIKGTITKKQMDLYNEIIDKAINEYKNYLNVEREYVEKSFDDKELGKELADINYLRKLKLFDLALERLRAGLRYAARAKK